MIPIGAIIVDDEPNARMSIKGMLESNFAHVRILAECANVPEAVKAIQKFKPEVIFLDIEMPGQNGFALFDYFDEKEITFKVVFVTAYSDFSLQAFELAAVDYLLKPVRVEHLARALNKVDGYYNHSAKYIVLKENNKSDVEKKMVLQTNDIIYVIKLGDIVFIQAEGNYTKFHTTQHGLITISKPIAEFDYLENGYHFYRSHRSYIINLDKIKKVDKKNYVIIMCNDEQAHLSQDKKQHLIEKIESR